MEAQLTGPDTIWRTSMLFWHLKASLLLLLFSNLPSVAFAQTKLWDKT